MTQHFVLSKWAIILVVPVSFQIGPEPSPYTEANPVAHTSAVRVRVRACVRVFVLLLLLGCRLSNAERSFCCIDVTSTVVEQHPSLLHLDSTTRDMAYCRSNPRYFQYLPCSEKRYAADPCSPAYRHLFDHFFCTFFRSLFVPKHQQFEPENILCALSGEP